MPTVADLLSSGRLEAIPRDRVTAREQVAEARQHLVSARTVGTTDPPLAYVALYEAARKAVTAHMLANGLRAANRHGAHEAIGLYALAALATSANRTHVERFQTMRRVRNHVQYGRQVLGIQMIESDLAHAAALVEAVARSLRLG